MRSKQTIIAECASTCLTGLAVQAEETEVECRSSVITIITMPKCHINIGKATQEQPKQLYRDDLKELPHCKFAYKWAATSRDGKAAIKAMPPNLGADFDATISGVKAGKVLKT